MNADLQFLVLALLGYLYLGICCKYSLSFLTFVLGRFLNSCLFGVFFFFCLFICLILYGMWICFLLFFPLIVGKFHIQNTSKELQLSIDLYDEIGIGGGASGVAGGLLHPYSPKGLCFLNIYTTPVLFLKAYLVSVGSTYMLVKSNIIFRCGIWIDIDSFTVLQKLYTILISFFFSILQ